MYKYQRNFGKPSQMAMKLRFSYNCNYAQLSLGLCLLWALGSAAELYTSKELLTWLQSSNFGYQVLQQANKQGNDEQANLSCALQVKQLLQDASNNSLAAIKLFDAWGKFPDGLLYGSFVDMGNYESCLGLPTSKYCLMNIQFESLSPQALAAISLRIGSCIPAACSAQQLDFWLQSYLDEVFERKTTSGGQLVQEHKCALPKREPMSGLDWFAVAVLVCLGLLVLLGSCLDYAKAKSAVVAFSLRQNLRQLLHITPAKSSSHVIPCLNGIRCLTIIWIILGHDYMFMLLSPNINAAEIKRPYSLLLQSGAISVDTFFLLSGMLVVLVTLRELERTKGKLNVPIMYLHRVVRLTPALALAVLLFVTLFPRLDNGPLWQEFTSSYQLCSSTWWATLLYVQNYAAAGRMCLGHTWYLAVDMQLFILSPLLLLPLWHWRRKAVAGIVLLIMLLFACVFSIVMLNELIVFSRTGNLGADSVAMRKIYYTTHARATPWLIGLLFGYLLHTERGRKRRLPKWLVLLAWSVSLALICSVLFVVYPFTQSGAAEMTPLAGACYLCCSRIAWPLALCWFIWACHNGYGGFINHLLSWSFWQPLAKLSYGMYIWHLLVETVHAARSKLSLHFSDYDAILRFWSDFGITVLISLVMYLCLEAPLARLQMQMLRKYVYTNKAKSSAKLAATTIPKSTTGSTQNLVDALNLKS